MTPELIGPVRRMSILLLGILFLLPGGCSSPPPGHGNTIEDYSLENLHQVSQEVYRSGQPERLDFAELQKRGLRSVLNLRRHHSDEDDIRGLSLTLYELPLNAGSLKESELRAALKIIRHAPKPLLIHCWHGSDRTGAVTAAYRIVEQNWPVEDAVRELQQDEYGHHDIIYSNIPKLLRSIDWAQMKKP